MHPRPVINIRTCKIMNGWTGSGLVSLNLAAALSVAASTCEARTNRAGRERLLSDVKSKFFAMGR